MIPVGSRYERAERAFGLAHIYNEFGYPILESDNANLKVRVVSREVTYMPPSETFLGTVQAQEYYAKDTENIQFLGYKFLGDAKRWWQVADVNPQVWYPLDLKMGDYLQLPSP